MPGPGAQRRQRARSLVGGSEAAFAKAKPILEKMGKNIVHAGATGNGQAAKICNNMILGVSMIAVSEGFMLAKRLGLDAQKLFDVASTSSGQCWSLTNYCPVPGPVPTSPANRDYQAGFTAAMMLKDLMLAQQAANAAGASTPLGAEAASQPANSGNGAKDFSGIIRMLDGK
jgi:3-hydroxyisobutyrate dehydrogenase